MYRLNRRPDMAKADLQRAPPYDLAALKAAYVGESGFKCAFPCHVKVVGDAIRSVRVAAQGELSTSHFGIPTKCIVRRVQFGNTTANTLGIDLRRDVMVDTRL